MTSHVLLLDFADFGSSMKEITPLNQALRHAIPAFLVLAVGASLSGCSDECWGKDEPEHAQCVAARDAKKDSAADSGGTSAGGSKNSGGAASMRDDDAPTGCTQLGTLDSTAEISGWLKFFFDADDDHQDYYCFTLADPNISTVTVGLNTGGAKVSKYKDVLTADDAIPPSMTAANSWDLPPGDYALMIDRAPGQDQGITYEAVVTREDLGTSLPDTDPGATPDLATAIDVNEDDLTSATGYVGALNQVDLYRVTVPNHRTLDLDLVNSGVTGPVQVLSAPYGKIVADTQYMSLLSAPEGGEVKAISGALAGGDYLLKVTGTGVYRLRLIISAPLTGMGGAGP